MKKQNHRAVKTVVPHGSFSDVTVLSQCAAAMVVQFLPCLVQGVDTSLWFLLLRLIPVKSRSFLTPSQFSGFPTHFTKLDSILVQPNASVLCLSNNTKITNKICVYKFHHFMVWHSSEGHYTLFVYKRHVPKNPRTPHDQLFWSVLLEDRHTW